MKVLVTGGAGFIGSHVVEELIYHRYEVVVVDNLVTGRRHNLPDQVKLYEMDINDPHLETVFQLEKPDHVIHLAAQASVVESLKSPYFDFETNMTGTVKVALLAEQYHVRKMIFASTAAVYGDPVYLPVDEQHPVSQQSYYALSKYSAERFIELSNLLQGLNYTILRFSNVYGPKQNAEGEAGVVSIFINRLLASEEVTIYDGSQTRDFIYVKDVATACRLAMESETIGVFNISSAKDIPILHLFERLSDMMGIYATPVFEPARVGEIKQSVLDNSNARYGLGWEIRFPLKAGLSETIRYYSESVYGPKVNKQDMK
ncbi:NAD-dependent epimerase/dehydratase family protein [Sporosarcina sp. 179-K 3D1 HS]|uniref:NAD-dependent epimerase/dehydratase family protein n=1 Tax=Sporosarcina sp. 179-K 3D1 HS TaxID=3232169 RepID=UPI00399FC2DA